MSASFGSCKDVQHSLCQMILLNGVLTDANLPGVEKVCVTMVHSSWLEVPMHKVSKEDIGYEGDLAGPGCTFMVKGWNRSVSFLAVCLAGFMDSSLIEAVRKYL